MQVRLVPMTLLAGMGAGVASVALYQWWWGLLLAAVTVLLVLLAAPAGWGTRLPFALGFAFAIALLSLTRGEGDYLVASTGAGYALLALGLAVLMLGVATLPRPGRRTPPGDGRRTAPIAGPE